MKKLMSIVVPCYNEEEAIPIFYIELLNNLKEIDLDYEVIFVDDGSKDNTSKVIKDLANKNDCCKYIIFSRNFGKEAAMYAGLKGSKGDYVAIMDADLQDPPTKLKEMYEGIVNEGYDCVATRRVTRKGEPKIRSLFARAFYKIINKRIKVEIVDGARDFRLMSRVMVDSILEDKEKNRFSKGIFSWVGFKTKWLEYENIERCAGVTKWNFAKLFAYAIEGFVSYSVAPLYNLIKFGFALLFIDIVAVVTLLLVNIGYVEQIILIGSMGLFSSLIIIALGVSGIYQAKMYNEIKDRPIYIAKEENTSKKAEND